MILTSGTEQYLITCTNKKIYIFTDNYLDNQRVRDYQGHNSVNKEIGNTLVSSTPEDFWWLNNGVTIVAEDVSQEHQTIADC